MARMQPPASAPDPEPLLGAGDPDEPRDGGPSDGPQRPVVRRGLVPQALLDPDAVFTVKRLQKNGHEAYLVGGCVRDLLAGHEPKDFDVATDAHPPRIRRLFHSARIIGRRFRLVHVRFPGDHVVETSTFRADPERYAAEAAAAGESVDAWLEHVGPENVYGTAPEDARRRDFTINALFYDPVRDEVIDWVGGLADLEARLVRSIGDPARRIAEDPVRMIRAVHFAHRLGFTLEPGLEAAIEEQAGRIADASGARLYIELLKIVGRGHARATLHRLWELSVLAAWIPELAAFLDRPMGWPEEAGGTHVEASRGEPADLPTAHATWNLLGAADRWGLGAHGAPESLALATLFGPWLLESWQRTGLQGYPAFASHVEDVFRGIALRMSVPRWVAARIRDTLWMLLELRHPPGPRPRRRLFARPGFGEALALLEMDLHARNSSEELFLAWCDAAEDADAPTELLGTADARAETLADFPPDERPRRGRRRGGRARGRTPDDSRNANTVFAEADAFEPPPVHGEPPEAFEDPPPLSPPALSPPTMPPPARPPPARSEPAAPPRPPPAPARQAPVEAPRERPPPLLADDDFSAGL